MDYSNLFFSGFIAVSTKSSKPNGYRPAYAAVVPPRRKWTRPTMSPIHERAPSLPPLPLPTHLVRAPLTSSPRSSRRSLSLSSTPKSIAARQNTEPHIDAWDSAKMHRRARSLNLILPRDAEDSPNTLLGAFPEQFSPLSPQSFRRTLIDTCPPSGEPQSDASSSALPMADSPVVSAHGLDRPVPPVETPPRCVADALVGSERRAAASNKMGRLPGLSPVVASPLTEHGGGWTEGDLATDWRQVIDDLLHDDV